jgi:hypothetical protein
MKLGGLGRYCVMYRPRCRGRAWEVSNLRPQKIPQAIKEIPPLCQLSYRPTKKTREGVRAEARNLQPTTTELETYFEVQSRFSISEGSARGWGTFMRAYPSRAFVAYRSSGIVSYPPSFPISPQVVYGYDWRLCTLYYETIVMIKHYFCNIVNGT